MRYRVGPKGQVVIAKEFRDRLGVEPGSLAIQRVVDDHLEIHFLPAARNRSLRGILAPYTRVSLPPEKWHEAVEQAWEEAALEDWGRQSS